jgi:hypothetical protein
MAAESLIITQSLPRGWDRSAERPGPKAEEGIEGRDYRFPCSSCGSTTLRALLLSRLHHQLVELSNPDGEVAMGERLQDF